LRRTFSLDSCNENLPEKNIHQNYVGRCGAVPPLETFHGRTRAPPRPAAERNLRLRETIGGAVSLFPDCYLQCVLQLQRVAGSRLVFRPREAMNGRDNNAAVISEQRESHDQNLGAKHLGQRAEG
jgi:hypothetical protein